MCIKIKSIEKYLITQKKLMVVLTCMGHLQPRLMNFFLKKLTSLFGFSNVPDDNLRCIKDKFNFSNVPDNLVFLMYLMIALDV